MVVCAFAFIAPVNDTDAAPAEPITTGAEFVTALTGGGDYILKNDITVSFTAPTTVNNTVNIDLAGYTVTATGGYSMAIANSEAGKAALTLSNGTINWTGFTDGTVAAFSIEKNGTLNLKNINFTTNGAAVYPNGAASKVSIENCKITGGTYAVATNNQVSDKNTVDIDITRSTLVGTSWKNNDKDSCAVLINIPNVTLDITDSTIRGERQSLFVRCGTANVTNTVIDFTDAYAGKDKVVKTWGSGNNVPSAAVVAGDASDSSYAGTASLTMTGCTVNARSGNAIITSADTNTGLDFKLVNTTVDIAGNTAKLDGINVTTAGFSISQGSIIIDGTYTVETTGGSITITSGEGSVKTIPANADIIVAQGAKLTVKTGDSLTVDGTITVQNGATLSIEGTVTGTGEITVCENAQMNISGDASAASINNAGTINVTSENAQLPPTIGGTGSVEVSSDVQSEATISGDWRSFMYTENQVVTLTGDTTLVTGAQVVIYGKLIIPAGMTLTIKDGAQLVVDKVTGSIENNGTIVVESAAGAINGGYVEGTTPNAWSKSGYVSPYTTQANTGGLVILNGKVVNNGTVELAYSSTTESISVNPGMNISATVINNGNINVGSYSFLYIWNTLINGNDGVVTVDGQIMHDGETGKVIKNAGSIIIDGIVYEHEIIISNTDNDAVVNIVSADAKNGDVAITVKNGIALAAEETYNVDAFVTITVTDGCTIQDITATVDSVKASTYATDKKYDGYVMLSGNVAVELTTAGEGTATAAIAATNGKIDEALAIGKGITFDLTEGIINGTLTLAEITTAAPVLTLGGKITVAGSIIAEDNAQIAVATSGTTEIDVTGTIQSVEQITILNNVNGVYYATKNATVTTYFVSTLENAVAAVADAGNTSTTKDVTICGDVKVKENLTIPSPLKVKFNAGATLTIDTSAVVTVKAGATITCSASEAITVDGALTYENKKTGDGARTATVSDVITEAEATDGFRTYSGIAYALANASEGDVVKLSRNVLITENVTVPAGITLDTNGRSITFQNTETKKPVMTVDGTVYITTGSLVPSEKENIALNGVIKSDNALSTDIQALVAGAYYSINNGTKTVYYVTPVEDAAKIITTVDNSTITLRGDLKIGDVSFSGTADEPAMVIVTGKLTAQTITVNNTGIDFDAVEFDGTVTNGNGSIIMKGTADADFLVGSGDKDGVQALGFEGDFTVAANTNFRITGTVYAFDSTIIGVVVDGTLNVDNDEGTGISTFNGIVISGTVNVLNNAQMNANKITVLGTLVAAPAATGLIEGKVLVGILFVGETEDYITTGAVASVSGTVTVNQYALVMAGSTVPKSVTDLAKTEFMVADKLYLTAYVSTTATDATTTDVPCYKDVDAHIENARFDGWYVNGEKMDNEPIAPGTAIAKVTYDVYQITVYADEGIANVYIDSNIMQYGMYNDDNGNFVYGYRLMVAAGEHTITYTLKNGWTGTAVLKVNGDAVSGNTFTTEGTPATGVIDYTLQLTGIEKSGYVPDAPDKEDTGMTITDYLLIILVVLIVVMAIIVAMRMMRS